jgi:hypothetical protein
MRHRDERKPDSAEKTVRDIRRATREQVLAAAAKKPDPS